MRFIVCLLLACLLAACGGPEQRGEEGDRIPDQTVEASRVKDAVPKPEPRSRYGNHSPYTVLGKTYHVAATAEGYNARGTASWYGNKFHGRKTSSGEPFDMYAATAAHRSLPLPTYAEVTNLDNGRSIIVKINDRGPFHSERIIDLSYGAAVRLDMVRTGTAPVRVRAITFGDNRDGPLLANAGDEDITLQIGAFSDKDRARAVVDRLEDRGVDDVSIDRARSSAGRVYRVLVGPIRNAQLANEIAALAVDMGLGRPHQLR